MRLEIVQAWSIQGPRPYQEDAGAFSGNHAVVCDGVARSQNGGLAAELATKTFLSGVDAAAVRKWINRKKEVGGGATTIAHVTLAGDFLHIAWSGDSRVTLIRGRRYDTRTWMTADHCLPAPDNNALTQCLTGGHAPFAMDTWMVREGDLVMLTTDGVHDHVSEYWADAENPDFKDEVAKRTGDNATCIVFRVTGQAVTVL